MSSVAKLIIRKHRPYFYVAIFIGFIALTFFIQRYLYLKETHVQQQQIKKYKQQDDFYQQLRKKNEEMSKYILRSDTQLENNKYELDLQIATIDQLEQQLSLQQEQLATFNKELLFYEMITQGDRPNKLQIRELLLRSDVVNSDTIHYQLVITQGKKINQAITGTIEMIGNMSAEKSSVIAEHALNLRHVQLIEGQIKILDNNEPESITITIKQKNKTLLSQSFDWQLSPP